MTDKTVRWGVIGPGAIAHNYAAGLQAAPNAQLVAVYGRSTERRDAYADKHGIDADRRHDTLDGLLADPEVDAVYIATPHPQHAQMAIDALRAGKAVLCEKPAGLNRAEVAAMVDCARDCERFFMEGFMYLCHPQIARLVELVSSGAIGKVEHIEAQLCFAAPFDPASRLYDPALGGGAIMDVGCYPASFARLVAGAAAGTRFSDPLRVRAVARKAPSGVDEFTVALLEFSDGITAQCSAAVARDLPMIATVQGSKGLVTLEDPWMPGRDAGPANARLRLESADGGTVEEAFEFPEILFALEAEFASQAILDGRLEAPAPAMGWRDSVGNAAVLQAWRDEIGLEYEHEKGASSRPLRKVVAAPAKGMGAVEIPGVGKPMSKLVIGCDNQERASDGAVIWDAWLEAGGNAFDTGWIYGMGLMERLLGEWIAARGVRDQVALIVKGCHTPCCEPAHLRWQLDESLARLRTGRADVYILHRDNPDVPVGEWIDALDELAAEGVVGATGGSNWSVERFAAANEWAQANGRRPLAVLNNNLALATMTRPVWPGCVSSNTPATLAWLRESGATHLSWSSQARGYFADPAERSPLAPDTSPETCFAGADNEERRRRACELAEEKGVKPTNVAVAWVLGQSFPSLALVGPRSPREISSSLPGPQLALSASELAWLNLEADGR